MNFKHLSTFVEVARCGNFSAAAIHLHTVQSAVSRHISALEDSLGVQLLERSTRQVALTAAGAAFLNHATAILDHCDEARRDACLVADGRKGLLRIGFMSSACSHFLPLLLRRFAAAEPEVDVRIHEMTAAEQLRGFTDGVIDIGFSRPVESVLDIPIERRHLSNDPIYAVVSDRHPLAKRKSIDLADLVGHDLTLFARAHARAMFDMLISAFQRLQQQPLVKSQPTSMQALLAEVASSSRVGLVPGCVRDLQTRGCHFIKLKQRLSIPLEMHWLSKPSATARVWVDWCSQQKDLAEMTRF